MARKIEKFALAWHPTRGCAYRIKTEGTSVWSNWISVSSSDLAALAGIFNETPVYLHPNGGISTDAASVGVDD